MLTHNAIHRSDLLHQGAGTFFSHYYGDAERLFSLFDSYCWAGQLLLEEALDAVRLFYRHQIPPLHRDFFVPVTITERDFLEGKDKWFRYGDAGLKYGQHLRYGVPGGDIAGVVPLPASVVDADLCTNIPVDPTVILFKNSDFEIRDRHLVFQRNVFDLFPSEGEMPNRSCTFWLRSAYSDRHYIQNRLGVLTKTFGPSTENYLEFCNLIMDSVMEGTSAASITQIVCRLFDVPCTQEMETVEVLDSSGIEKCLVTDKRVYFAPDGAEFLYREGTTLPLGTVLTDAITVIQHKQLPKGMPLYLERRFLGNDYLSGLLFPNKDYRLIFDMHGACACIPSADSDSPCCANSSCHPGYRCVHAKWGKAMGKWGTPMGKWGSVHCFCEPDPCFGQGCRNGQPDIRALFPIIGRAEDVTRFWNTFYDRVLDEDLLAKVSPGNWINPAQFVYEHVFYPRIRFFQIDIAKTGKEKLPMVNTKILRSLVPPGVLLSLQTQAPPAPEPEIGVNVRGVAKTPGVGLRRVACSVSFTGEKGTIRAC